MKNNKIAACDGKSFDFLKVGLIILETYRVVLNEQHKIFANIRRVPIYSGQNAYDLCQIMLGLGPNQMMVFGNVA